VSFYERREVKDVLAYLRLIRYPRDDEAFARIVNVTPAGDRRRVVRSAGAAATPVGQPLLDAAGRPSGSPTCGPTLRAALSGWPRWIDDLRRGMRGRSATALEQAVAAVGYASIWPTRDPRGSSASRRAGADRRGGGVAETAETTGMRPGMKPGRG